MLSVYRLKQEEEEEMKTFFLLLWRFTADRRQQPEKANMAARRFHV